jgi:hypothetical protein
MTEFSAGLCSRRGWLSGGRARAGCLKSRLARPPLRRLRRPVALGRGPRHKPWHSSPLVNFKALHISRSGSGSSGPWNSNSNPLRSRPPEVVAIIGETCKRHQQTVVANHRKSPKCVGINVVGMEEERCAPHSMPSWVSPPVGDFRLTQHPVDRPPVRAIRKLTPMRWPAQRPRSSRGQRGRGRFFTGYGSVAGERERNPYAAEPNHDPRIGVHLWGYSSEWRAVRATSRSGRH